MLPVAGQNVSFIAAALGGPAPTVQWQVSVNNGASFGNIPGATSLTYTFPAALSENGDEYRAVFTNSQGSAVTNPATLAVTSALTIPVVTLQPISEDVGPVQSVSFTAAGSGNPTPSVQCQVSTDSTTFNNIAGATSLTYTLLAALSQSGYLFRAVFTNSQGSAATNPATLTVAAVLAAPVVTVQPISQSAAPGQNVTFSAAANGNPAPSVQWQVSTNGTTFANIAGATSLTYTLLAALSQSGYLFRAVFTNSQGSAATNPGTLTVTTALTIPAVIAQPANQSVIAGQSATFAADANGNPTPTVQWQVSTNGVAFSDISGATSPTYTFAPALSQGGYLIRAVFTNSQGSATTNSAPRTVTAAAAIPVVTAQPIGLSAVVGQNVSFTAAASGFPAPTVQWRVSTDGGATFTDIPGAASTTESLTVGLSENGYLYDCVFTNVQGSATTNAVALTVTATAVAPAVTSPPVSESVGVGQMATFTAAASGSPTPGVQWQVSAGGGATYADIAGATSSPYTFTATPNENGNVYHAVFTNSQGSTTTAPATLTVAGVSSVMPLPVVPALVGSLPSDVVAGQTSPIRQTVTIKNFTGATFAGAVAATFFLSTDGTMNSTAILLPTSVSKRLNLKTGKSTVLHLKLKGLPPATPPGVYHLGVELTGLGGATSVGSSGSAITVEAAEIDLSGAVSSLPGREKIGAKIGATITVTNNGNVAADGPLQMAFHASGDGSLANATVVLPAFTQTIRIKPGKTMEIHVGGIILSTSPGSYYLIGQLDPNAAFPDINPTGEIFASKLVTVG